MTPKIEAELITKCRRLFYDRVTGQAIGVASGGGAIATLHGEALVIATFNNPDAFSRIGVVECYFSPLGQGEPYSVDLARVALMESTSAAYHSNPTDQTARALCDARDAAVVFTKPV